MVDGVLRVRLSRFDHVFGLVGDLEVPAEDVTSAEVVPDGLRAVPGWRAPGLAWPGRVKVGTWRSKGSRWYVVARRGQPAMVLHFSGHRWAGAVLTCSDAEALTRALTPPLAP